MELSKRRSEAAVLKSKVDAAKLRLLNAQKELNSVLEQLAELPLGLKTGVMKAIESAFDELKQAELYVTEVEEIVREESPAEVVEASAVEGDQSPLYRPGV